MDGVLSDVRNVENVCRLCLSAEEPRSSVFADRASAVSLATKIRACLSIEILASDKLSTSICGDCLTRVNKCHAYKESCLRSQEKLQRCLAERAESIPQLQNIKTEPMDFDEPAGSLETVPLTSDEEWESLADECNDSTERAIRPRADKPISPKESLSIKREALEDEENQNNTEIESVCSTELLLNPMAVSTSKEDRIMEADSTQKLFNPKSLRGRKKKVRRGPSTHYRGARKFKQRCNFCQIYLHSKHSYKKHMDRFHSGKPEVKVKTLKKIPKIERKKIVAKIGVDEEIEELEEMEEMEEMEEIEEMIEDVEDELISLEKDAPLTPVQQNIISQLKTFSCYSCRQSFNDRRSTLNHIRQHMPDLRPYTCIACLTEFADRSIYKLHCGASFQCAMKIALVVPEHGTEKYFTCNMCLRPLSNRKELLSHLSKHSDRQYEQLVGGNFRSPPKLKPMPAISSRNSGKFDFSIDRIPVPYMNGDPAHNNPCQLCGMIYKHKQNLAKHVDLCEKLPAENRLCYRCVICGATFLAFNKFQTHLKADHKKRDFVCSKCWQSFKEPNDYVDHYRGHRSKDSTIGDENLIADNGDNDRSRKIKNLEENSILKISKSTNRWSCVLCPESNFSTRAELAEHRKIHLKVKIYSCSICRRMFGRASALESHMIEHNNNAFAANNSQPAPLKFDEESFPESEANLSKISINSDPGASSSECPTCGKVFASYHNLRRHVRNVHEAPGRYSCFSCAKNFKTERDWLDHVEAEHRENDFSLRCPKCTETFENNEELTAHRREIHGAEGEDPLACYICGKIFETVNSLRIHRGHHFRVNSRLSIGNIATSLSRRLPIEEDDDPISIVPTRAPSAHRDLSAKLPKARKSFPNSSPARSAQSILQCQVCDDRFDDVANLRRHLWDVHCARNKPEKEFPSVKHQCELCTNVLPDEESLRSHMNWHRSNPILSNNVAAKCEAEMPAECDICGKFYSSVGNLKKHKKRHKVRNFAVPMATTNRRGGKWGGEGFACDYCRKVFATNATLKKHRVACRPQPPRGGASGGAPKKPRATNQPIDPVRPKLDFDSILSDQGIFNGSPTEGAVTCNLCRKMLPSRQELYKHRVRVHRIVKTDTELYGVAAKVGVSCTSCDKVFTNLASMKQHFTKVHGNRTAQYRCSIDGCGLVFRSDLAKRNHEKSHVGVTYACPVCPRRVNSRAAINEHINKEHKNNYSMARRQVDKSANMKKINLDNYVIKGANGRQCPLCKITYPNFKALKVHYIKMHEGVA